MTKGRVAEADRDAALDRIEFTTDLAGLADRQLVVESVREDEQVKREVFTFLDKVVSDPDAILATNTSSLSVARLARATERSGHVIGIHFFNPVPALPLVEIVPSVLTTPDTTERATRFATGLGKTVIEAPDRAGFVINALLFPYLLSAIRMVDTGLATAETIDRGMQLGCSHPRTASARRPHRPGHHGGHRRGHVRGDQGTPLRPASAAAAHGRVRNPRQEIRAGLLPLRLNADRRPSSAGFRSSPFAITAAGRPCPDIPDGRHFSPLRPKDPLPLSGGDPYRYPQCPGPADHPYSGRKRMSLETEVGKTVRHDLPRDAVAVVGMSCRFPGADDPDAFWQLLRDGRDALSQPPADRTELHAKNRAPAGYLDDVAHFDPEFFGISPREATGIDPQQRLVLELVWEALEHAGIVPGTLHGTRTGVVVGAMWDEYAKLAHERGADAATHSTITGVSRGTIANRVSYALGLRGPSLVVDTAQSSSLVAVQLACEQLVRGDVEFVLVSGVSLNLTPESFTVAEKFGALSPQGRAFTFDERADGYVRGEGAKIVALKLLSRAIEDGDVVHGVIRGGAVNNDGGGTTLTAPSAEAQQDLLRRAYDRTGVDPADVRFVELHGTGTRVGDPVEAAALGEVLGRTRRAGSPLPVGSVKTNIGHLEGAVSIAGLVKALLCLREGALVPSLNFRRAHPDIPLDELNLTVNTELLPLPDGEVLAGVSSFGMTGTNCHLVLSRWQPEPEHPRSPRRTAPDPSCPSRCRAGPSKRCGTRRPACASTSPTGPGRRSWTWRTRSPPPAPGSRTARSFWPTATTNSSVHLRR